MFQNELPIFPNFGKVMTGGCRGFAKKVMSWPQDLIIGGVSAANGTIKSAEALQSIFLVASAGDVYNRFKVNNVRCLQFTFSCYLQRKRLSFAVSSMCAYKMTCHRDATYIKIL